MKYQIILSYDGKKYNGWQKQGNTTNTIQEKLEAMLSRRFGETVTVQGAGRTDAGVHALAQSASFSLSCPIERISDTLQELNSYLPEDIRILKLIPQEERFHARLNASGKHYQYRLCTGTIQSPFERNYSLHVTEPLCLEKMQDAAREFTGTHDFIAFCSNKHMKKSSIRTIHKITFSQKNNILSIDFYGDGFLYHMIRILTGTLIEVGAGRMNVESISEILSKKDRALAGPCVPGKGLFLVEVYYE